MIIDIPGNEGGIVISIEVARQWRQARECQHAQVTVDPTFAELICQGCARKLNPVEWIAWLASRWDSVMNSYRAARAENERLALKRKAKCRDCGSFVELRGNDADEKRRRAGAEARLRAALGRIAALRGEAAAELAPAIAREVLAQFEPLPAEEAEPRTR